MTGKQSVGNCPGEDSCKDFRKAAGKTRLEKEENACKACPMFSTKPRSTDDLATDEIAEIVADVAFIIDEQNGGEKTDWKLHDPELFPLVIEWRKCEKILREIKEMRLHNTLRAIAGTFKKK